MKKLQWIFSPLICLLAMVSSLSVSAQYRKDKLLNRPYADSRPWHLGFGVGVHTEGLNLTNNGKVTTGADGKPERWFAEQPSYSPGFCVNGLLSVRLNDYFSARFTPGIWFGNRGVTFRDADSGEQESVDIKSAYIVLPADIKFASQRWRNLRPFVTAGIMPAFDVSKQPEQDILRLKDNDVYLTVGFGSDIYLEYFKLCPEVKFSFGLANLLQTNRPELKEIPGRINFTNSLSKVTANMVTFSFNFE